MFFYYKKNPSVCAVYRWRLARVFGFWYSSYPIESCFTKAPTLLQAQWFSRPLCSSHCVLDIVVFRKVAKGAHSSPGFVLSELDCAIASTMGRTKNSALKNHIYCELLGSVACQVQIKQRARKKTTIRNLLSSEFFATFMKSTIFESQAAVRGEAAWYPLGF